MPLNLNSDKLIVVAKHQHMVVEVQPEQQPVIYTGATTALINVGGGEEIYAGLQGTFSKIRSLVAGSGATVTQSGDTIIIDSNVNTSNFISNTTFDNYTGATEIVLTGQTADINYISGETLSNYQAITGLSTTLGQIGIELWDLEDAFTGHTGNTSIHYPQSGISITESQVQGLVGKYSLSGHTHDLRYSQLGHVHAISGVTGLQGALNSKSNTGHTHSQYLTGVTSAQITGVTDSLYLHTDALNGYWNSGQTTQAINAATSGLTSSWSGLTGQPTDNADLMLVFSGYSLTGHNHTGIYSPVNHLHIGVYTPTGTTASLSQTVSNHTGNTNIHFPMSGISITESQISNLQDYALESQLTGHTSNLTIHYPQSGITISESQVTGLVGKYSLSGHTHPQYLTGFTVTAPMVTGITASLYAPIVHYHPQYLTGFTVTTPMVTGITASLYLPINALNGYWDSGETQQAIVAATSGLSSTWVDITGKPAWLTGTTIGQFQLGHSHSQYLTGITGYVTTGQFTGLTSSFDTHTGNTTIHFPQSGISITESQVQGLVGKYSLSGHNHNTLYSVLGHTHVISGVTGLQSALDGKSGTGHTHTGVYAPVIHTHAYSAITNIPDLNAYALSGHTHVTLTGLTINESQVTNLVQDLAAKSNTGHTHSYTGGSITDLPTLFNGAYSGLTGAPDLSVYQPVSGMSSYWTSAQTVSYVSGQTSGLTSSWTTLEDKPQWLSASTLNAFQTGHTHAYSGLSGLPTLFTGNTFVESGATQITQVGNVVTIYTNPTGTTTTLVGSGNTTVDNVSGNTWVVYSPTGGTGASSLAALTDVNVSGVTNYDTIQYLSGTTKWTKSTPVDLFTNVTDGEMLIRSGTTIVSEPVMHVMRTTENQTINSGAGTFVNVTSLSFPVVSGTSYAFYFYVRFKSAAATTGWKMGVNCPTGDLDFWAGTDGIANAAAGAATHLERHNVDRDDMTLLTATVTANVVLANRIDGCYVCTQNGTFAVRFANELANDTNIVVQKGSYGWWF